jgi:diadenosine tetraphosphatase ApaH/serine/threonine PP2A family protein phosphatase
MINIREIIEFPEKLKELDEGNILNIVSRALDFLKNEPMLVRLNFGKAYFVGDTHGDLQSTINIAHILKNTDVHIVFLGDYVDRGPNQLENINYILALKAEFPSRITLLRGNHEIPHVNYYYGFLVETIKKFSQNLYDKYCECFSFMPYSALVDSRILALHGGLAEKLTDLKQIESLPKGEMEPKNQIALQILWNDPNEDISGFQPSIRGSMIRDFGRDVFERFAETNGLDMIIRAHQYFAEGYHYYFDEKILSLFTCRYYPSVDPKIAFYDERKIKLLSVK